MPRRNNTADDVARKNKLKEILRQFDSTVEYYQFKKKVEMEQMITSVEARYKMALCRMSPADADTNWESLYAHWCGDAASVPAGGATSGATTGATASPPAALSAASSAALTRDQRPAATYPKPSDLVAALLHPTRAAPARTLAVAATPLQPPQPLVASTPLVRAKFDPNTVLPSTMRRHRPNELLMSMRGSPVVAVPLDPTAVVPAEQDHDEPSLLVHTDRKRRCTRSRAPFVTPAPAPAPSQRRQVLTATAQLLDSDGDMLVRMEEDKQLLVQLRDKLNALPLANL